MNTIEKYISPLHLYSLNTIELENIDTRNIDDNYTIYNMFWDPNPLLVGSLCNKLTKYRISNNIADIACGDNHFPVATHLLDFNNNLIPNKTVFKVDLDFDKVPYDDKYFNYIYSRHTLEDIQNPQHAFNEFIRTGKKGFIETPSPLIEFMNDIDGTNISYKYKGYAHHRYIVWSCLKTNTLYFLPKYPIIEHIQIDDYMLKIYKYLLNNYSVYWNNYYTWDENNKPNSIVYRNDINMNILEDYERLLNEAIMNSIEYTNQFIKSLKSFSTTNS